MSDSNSHELDEEDWYDDDLDDDHHAENDSHPCPECGKPVSVIAVKCPFCGYWVTDKDRAAFDPSKTKPLWIRATAAMLIIALLAGILIGIAARIF